MGFCGTKVCETKIDCKEIGNLNEGLYMVESCTDGLCVFTPIAVMSSGASRRSLWKIVHYYPIPNEIKSWHNFLKK